MSAKFYTLLRLLQKELNYQEKILALLARERAAIVKLDQPELEEVRVAKEKLLDDASQVTGKREQLMRALAEELTGNERDTLLSQLLEKCSDDQVKRDLGKTGESLKKAAGSVKEMNDQNGELIKQSLGLVSTTIAIIQSAPGTDLPTYSREKRLSSDTDDMGFLRRGKSVISSA